MAGTMDETLEKNTEYFLEVQTENNGPCEDVKDNHSKFVEIMNMMPKKEEKVAELREKLAALKEKESETKEKFDSEKAALDVHR